MAKPVDMVTMNREAFMRTLGFEPDEVGEVSSRGFFAATAAFEKVQAYARVYRLAANDPRIRVEFNGEDVAAAKAAWEADYLATTGVPYQLPPDAEPRLPE